MFVALCQTTEFIAETACPAFTIGTIDKSIYCFSFAIGIVDMIDGGSKIEDVLSEKVSCSSGTIVGGARKL